LANPEAIAVELSSFTLSHIARTISCEAIGSANKLVMVDAGVGFPFAVHNNRTAVVEIVINVMSFNAGGETPASGTLESIIWGVPGNSVVRRRIRSLKRI